MRWIQSHFLVLIFPFAVLSCKSAPKGEGALKDVGTFESQPGTRIFSFTSPGHIMEKCKILPPFPDASDHYKKSDAKAEQEFCNINFYGKDIVLGPKNWSTSPGTVVYSGPAVRGSKNQDKTKVKRLATYKQTMNQPSTSGTFSQASLLYYHFARFFDTAVRVPPAVYREIDPQWHKENVADVAKGLSGMNRAGWGYLRHTSTYTPKNEMWTDDGKKIYGVMLSGKGDRYGEIVNGMRRAWGLPQNEDFLKTPGFYAAKTSGSLDDVLASAMSKCADCSASKMSGSIKVWKKSASIGTDESNKLAEKVQAIYWAKEMTEIAILDYIFSQQDRIGNIDYRWSWMWLEDNNGTWEKKDEIAKDDKETKAQIDRFLAGKKIKPGSLIRIMRTQLNDNDAGGRNSYANFTKKAKMLEAIRRMPADTYLRLMQLNADFKKGTGSVVLRYLQKYFFLSQRQLAQITSNVALAAETLKANCTNLTFDIKPGEYYETGKVEAERDVCTRGVPGFSADGGGSFALAGAADDLPTHALKAVQSASELSLTVNPKVLKSEVSEFNFNISLDFADYLNPREFPVVNADTDRSSDEEEGGSVDVTAGLQKISQITGTATRVGDTNTFIAKAIETFFGDDGIPVSEQAGGCELKFTVSDDPVIEAVVTNLGSTECQEYLGKEFKSEVLNSGLEFRF